MCIAGSKKCYDGDLQTNEFRHLRMKYKIFSITLNIQSFVSSICSFIRYL